MTNHITSSGKKVSIVYLANILTWQKSADEYQHVLSSLRGLPLADDALIIEKSLGIVDRTSWHHPVPLDRFLHHARALNPNVPSRHGAHYRFLMSRAQLLSIGQLTSRTLQLRQKVRFLDQFYLHAHSISQRSKSIDREFEFKRSEPFYDFFHQKDPSRYVRQGQFRNREAFRNYLGRRGFNDIDPFDFNFACYWLEIIGVIRQQDTSSLSDRREIGGTGYMASIVALAAFGAVAQFPEGLNPVNWFNWFSAFDGSYQNMMVGGSVIAIVGLLSGVMLSAYALGADQSAVVDVGTSHPHSNVLRHAA